MLENIDWGNALNLVLGAVALLGGGLWLKAKGKLSQVRNVVKEGYEAIQTVVVALDDDKIDKAEQAAIKKEALEAWVAIKVLLSIKKKE